MLIRNRDTCLLVIDAQEKLMPVMEQRTSLCKNLSLLLQTASALAIPQLVSRQYPQGLGDTVADIKKHLSSSAQTIDKTSFSAAQTAAFWQALAAHDERRQFVITGIEAHICVLQTAFDSLARGRTVFIVADAVSARKQESVDKALARMRSNGCQIVTTEMVLFEWLEKAGTALFKTISAQIR